MSVLEYTVGVHRVGHDSALLKREASARSVSYASALNEILLVSPHYVGDYQISVLDGDVPRRAKFRAARWHKRHFELLPHA